MGPVTRPTKLSSVSAISTSALPPPVRNIVSRQHVATAIVYCEANFGAIDGKTANGLVRHSERYEILPVIDSAKAGLDAGTVLDGKHNAIPIYHYLAETQANAGATPDCFIYGMVAASGMLSLHERSVVLGTMSHGMSSERRDN